MYELTVHGTPPGAEAEEAAQRGLNRIGAPQGITVMFSDNFVAEVRRQTGNPGYGGDRGAGVVAAKTIKRPEQGSLIIVNSSETRRLDVPELERLLAHEGGHALLHERGDHVASQHRSLVDYEWQWIMLCLGGLAIEEYRIEGALQAIGYDPGGTVQGNEHLEDSLVHLNAEVIWSLIDPDDTSPATMSRRVMTAQDVFTKILAYMAPYAGHDDAADPATLTPAGARHWRDYVGPLWQERRKVYQRIPDVRTGISAEDYTAVLRDGYALEMKQLHRIGFEPKGTDERPEFWRVATDARCTERHEAATHDAGS
ncbi:hypothetical protein [Isoptericola sp. NPDC056134]|uniref:hypothetical protein n=1 Tax=Isoptericola sp. NPDC056134 TaxID=3345723 RepID=UPI0035ED430B